MKKLLILFCWFLSIVPAWANQIIITKIDAEQHLVLNNGRIVKFYGLDLCDAEKAQNILNAWIGRSVVLKPAMIATDRHGFTLADVSDGAADLQDELLRTGAARFYPVQDNDAELANRLLGIEREVRLAGAGIWSDPKYAVQSSNHVGPYGTFQIVEGKVTTFERRKGAIYIDFGDDFRTDFTVFATPKDLARFRKADKDLETLQGRTVRVRGWVYMHNGPAMDLTDVSQLEIPDMTH